MKVTFREAHRDDVPAVVALLRDDVLGAGREAEGIEPYQKAFDEMNHEGNNSLFVGEVGGQVIATYQMTLITGLSLKATRRAQMESIRIADEYRGQGIGELLMTDAEDRARAGNAGLLQLTSNKQRSRAHSFYLGNGFVPSHEGFKKTL
ncbi:MAG: GNAT family N-acetyltransferase [Boseongicola sp.]